LKQTVSFNVLKLLWYYNLLTRYYHNLKANIYNKLILAVMKLRRQKGNFDKSYAHKRKQVFCTQYIYIMSYNL